MKASPRRPRGRRTKSCCFVIGAVLGGGAHLQGVEPSALPPALPLERRVVLDARRIEAALAHVRIWTPTETSGFFDGDLDTVGQDRSLRPGWDAADSTAVPSQAATPQTQAVFSFTIPQGLLAAAIRQFESITGLTVTVADDLVRNLTSEGITGTFTAAQGLDRLLAGSGLSHRSLSADTVVIEIRVSSDTVEVTTGAPRVQSSKYSAELTETPQTIQVIPRALLEEQGAATLTDALRNVPGITMQAGEGGGASNTSGDMFNMRGFSANNSIFVDGVRDDGLLTRDVYNLEQIEVFSGPTGSDVGRTNAAGYVNLTTKTPQRAAIRDASVSYGTREQVRTTADVNQPFSLGASGTFLGEAAVRLNVLWQDGGMAGRDYAGRESKAIAPSVAFGLSTPTRALLSGQLLRQDNLADYGLPAAASPIGPLTPTSVLAPTAVDQSNYYGSPDFDYDRGRQDNLALRVEHDFQSGLTLRNQTRYSETTREAVVTSIANPAAYNPTTNLVTLSRQANERHNDILSNLTHLAARVTTGSLRHDLSAGLELSTESQFAPTLTGVGTRAPVDLNRPDVFSPVVGMDIVPSGAFAEGSTDTVALYVFDAFDLGSRLRVNGGVRIDRYDTVSHSVSATGVPTDLRGDDTLVSGKAGVLYRLTERGNLYASYGSSVTPPGSANFQLNTAEGNQNNPNVDPQESTNYEVGTKWDLAPSRLQLSGSYFWTANKNVIFVVDSTSVPPVYNQDDAQRVQGVTVSAVGQITPRLDINMSVQYLDSEVESQNPTLDGNRLALAPELSGSLWATLRLPRDVRIAGGFRYTDPVYISTANTTVIPRYSVADALIEVPVSEHLIVRMNVYNVADRVYIRNINNNAGRYNRGIPRSFLLSSAIRF
jgi:catecholate siderophore receptor